MTAPILATKVFAPPLRPKVVPRPHLIERLNEGVHGKLTLISAPAGFGKTTLVSAWLATPNGLPLRPIAWLSLDKGDNDPARFLAYVIAALQTIAPNLGEGMLAVLHSPQPPPYESMLTTLLNEISKVSHKFVLVLDDYHVVDATEIDQALAFLLEHLPPQMHLVITTREDPQLPLARLRARGQMTDLRAGDLRFTESEATAFLNQMMGLKLSTEEIAALETRTEGWIAGLQLAALSMRGREDIAEFVKAFAGDNRYIADYLLEEVLQRQPERVRSFLLQTSILDRLSGPLCDAVTSRNDSMVLLDALERGNLFVVPLDDKRHWYRYHHLFADMIAAHALQEQPAQAPIMHRRASEWYAENGWPADAIRHALAAGDLARAAGLIELIWPAMDGHFQTATWLSWAQALPDALIRARPVLSVAYAWAFLNAGDLETGELRLQDAERWLDTPADRSAPMPPEDYRLPTDMVVADEAQFRTLPASIATARAYLAQARGDLLSSVQYGQAALDLLPKDDHLRRGPAAALLALAHWASGELEKAHQTLADAMTNFQKVGNLQFAISGTYGLADIRTTQGCLREAIEIYTKVLQLALGQGGPLLRGTAELYLGLSELYHEQGDAEAAVQHLLHSEALGEQAALPKSRHRFCRIQAHFKESQGDLTGALDLLDEAERLFRRGPVPDVRPLAAWKTRVWVAQGRLDEALRWAREQGLSVDDELSFLREFEHITLARVLLAKAIRDSASNTIHEAIGLLERLQQAAEAGGRMGSVIEIGVLQALAYQEQGNLTLALIALERTLRLAEPEGYVRIFVDQGASMARLLSATATQGILPDYIMKLLTAFAPVKASLNAAAPAHSLIAERAHSAIAERAHSAIAERASTIPRLIEPLSTRELEIVQLIAQGLSNAEISARLFLALSTVKGHNQTIFGKLQVQSRTEAVARARELNLL